MKLIGKHIEKDRSGCVTLCPEEMEDMWHVYNLITVGDKLKATTLRRVQRENSTGTVDSQRIRLTLGISVNNIDFDPQGGILRIRGRVILENKHVKMGSYHTIDLELNRNFTLAKPEWDVISLERIQEACDITKQADIAAIVLQEGLANICLVTQNMTIVRQRIEQSIPRKRNGHIKNYEKGLTKFFEQVMQGIERHISFDVVKVVIIASPGFVKDQLYEYVFAEAVKQDKRQLIENRSKFILVHCSSGHKHALQEVLQDSAIQGQLANTKYAQEVTALDKFYKMLNEDPDRAFYGWKHVKKAEERGAIGTLLLSDELFRAANIQTRRKYISLVGSVRSTGGKVLIFSSLHISGEHRLKIGLKNLQKISPRKIKSPANQPRRASVAIIIRIRPTIINSFETFSSDTNDNDIIEYEGNGKEDLSVVIEEFFNLTWVRRGTPEIIYIKRSLRDGDRWSGQIAFPGGKQDPDDLDDLDTAIRETSEEIGIDLENDKSFAYIGALDDREVTSTLGGKLLMTLSCFVFLQITHITPPTEISGSEISSIHSIPLSIFFDPIYTQRWNPVSIDLSLGLSKSRPIKFILSFLLGKVHFNSIILPNNNNDDNNNNGEGEGDDSLRLWGLTLQMTSDLIDLMYKEDEIPSRRLDATRPRFDYLDLNIFVWWLLKSNRNKYKEEQSNLITRRRVWANGWNDYYKSIQKSIIVIILTRSMIGLWFIRKNIY
ncbi:7454_t:CDS:10 [Entrophospora sp. SA101]|nr:2604_t:CDS:10 [Entrophospora sp. SA101]CAJ0910807.1 7454_t:CDS:10 [Entrophospora sp. SA101]